MTNEIPLPYILYSLVKKNEADTLYCCSEVGYGASMLPTPPAYNTGIEINYHKDGKAYISAIHHLHPELEYRLLEDGGAIATRRKK